MDILHKLYKDVLTLGEWLNRTTNLNTNSGECQKCLSDFTTIYVGCPTESQQKVTLTFSQSSHLHEIVLQVVQKTIVTNGVGSNVLVFGFSKVSNDPLSRSWRNIESRYPNSSVKYLQSSTWKKLLEIVGDKIMKHMLENLSLFLEVKPTCFVQLTGVPLHELWSFARGEVLRLDTRPTSKKKICPNKRNYVKSPNNKTSQATNGKKEKKHSTHLTFKRMKRLNNLSGFGYDELIGKSKAFAKANTSNTSNRSDVNTQYVGNDVETRKRTVEYEEDDVTYLNTQYVETRKKKVETDDDDDDVICSNTPFVDNIILTRKRKIQNEDNDMPKQKRRKLSSCVYSDSIKSSKQDDVSMKGKGDETNDESIISTLTFAGNVAGNTTNMSFKPYKSTVLLPRKLLLYNINAREKVPRSAPLTKLTQSGVLALYNSIFLESNDVTNPKVTIVPPTQEEIENIVNNRLSGAMVGNVAVIMPDQTVCVGPDQTVCVGPDQTVCVGSNCRVIPLLKGLLRNLRSCPYKTFINHYCPVQVGQNYRKSSASTKHKTQGFYRRAVPAIPLSRLLNAHTQKRQVYLFLRACLLHILPDRLIGGSKNRNHLLKKVSMLVSLGKFDKISLGQIMTGIKTSNVDWLQNISSNSCRLYLLARLVHWLFVNVIWVVLRTMFFITDTTFLGYKLIYYRQVVWRKIQVNALKGLITRNVLRPLPSKSRVQMLIQTDATLGVSTMRFLPKQNSLRPIIKMGVAVPEFPTKKLSINKQLTDLHHVLTYLKNRNQSLLGYGKLGTDEVRLPWERFVNKWRDLGQPKLYFVKTDITRCYDSIIQRKLFEIMEKLLEEEMQDEEYISARYVTVSRRRGMVHRQFDRKVTPLIEYDPNIETQSKKVLKHNTSNCILIDKMYHQFLTRTELLHTLHCHVYANVIKIGPKYYQLSEGISQGSVISTLMCSFYYADMERKYFNITDTEFLTRIVDDYLFVTPDIGNATRFLEQMMRGIPEYNCFTNKEKVLVNFPSDQAELSKLESEWFPWCGMMFNTKTCEISMDYQRYMGTSISDTMAFDLTSQPGKTLKEKLVYTARQKCRRIYVDKAVNSDDQITRNLFYLFVFSTLKFQAFVKKLPSKRPCGISLSLLEDLIKCLSQCIEKELKSTQESGNDTLFGLKINIVVKWLCRHAFIIQFKEHKAQYKTLLKSLMKCQTKLEKLMGNESVLQLLLVCGEETPDVFKSILN